MLVGANEAIDGRSELRFAHRDAARLAAALVSVSGFAPGDVHVLNDPQPEDVLRELDARLSGGTGVVLFYFSGHADPQALYTAGKPLLLTEVKRRLERAPAALKLGILDACHGGGWTRAKGLVTLSEPPRVKVVSSEGSALLASSSGLERAHESDSVQGSFFTHHLVAALRGAAEQTAAGEITLQAAFRYAEQHTVRDSALYAGEAQHPSFDLNLRGRTDVVLAQVGAGEAHLELAQTEGPLQVVDLKSGATLLELPAGEQRVKLAVEPGRYLVRRERPTGVFARDVDVEAGQSMDVGEQSLTLVGKPLVAAKQPEEDLSGLEISGGWAMPIAGGGGYYVIQSGAALAAGWRFNEWVGARARASWMLLNGRRPYLNVTGTTMVTEGLFGIDAVIVPLRLTLGTWGRLELLASVGTGGAVVFAYRAMPSSPFGTASEVFRTGAARVLYVPVSIAPAVRLFFGRRVAVMVETATHWVPGAEPNGGTDSFIQMMMAGVSVAL